MEEEKKEKTEALQKVQNQINESMDQNLVEEALSNNEVEFDYKDEKYRVRKPTFKEKQEVNKKRAKKYAQLLQDDDYMLETSLKKMYKKRGIDIDEMDRKLIQLEQKKKDISLKLGKALKEKRPDPELKTYREEILELQNKQTAISIEKVNLLQYSIETQVNIFIYAYLSYLVSEKKVEDKWVRAYKTYEEFENSEGPLTNKFIMLSSFLIQHELELNDK